MATYGGHDSFFAELQARFASEEAAEKLNQELMGSKNYLASNKLRSRLFKDSSMEIEPDKALLEEYKNFLTESYVKVLRLQIDLRKRYARGTFNRVGYASGNLKNSIKANTFIVTDRNIEKGTVEIGYTINGEYINMGTGGDYGAVLSEGRSASFIPYQPLIKWIESKISLGALRIKLPKSKGKKAKSTDRGDAIKMIAIRISKKASSEFKRPILKNWANYKQNVRFQRMFEKEIHKKGIYHRGKIRKSIMKNLNITYGSK